MDAASALVTPGPADAICWWKGKPTEASHFCAYSGRFAVESRQTDRTSHLDQPSSIFSCQGTVTVPPTPTPLPIPNGSRGASAADLCDRSLLEDRQTGDFYCHSSHFQKTFGERWSQRKLSGCCPPAQAPPSHFVSLGNEAAQCSLLLNVSERKCDWMDNESQLGSQSASTTSWWFWAKWITALKSYICSLKPVDTIGVSQ